MIESIHSSDGKEKKEWGNNTMFRIPKNIRQIGQVDSSKKIYIEDYVMTYIRQLAMKDYGSYKIAVLLGKFIKVNGLKHIFINGAVEAYHVDVENTTAFSNETWTNIYDDVKKYFDDVEIMGWYIARPGLMLETSDMITRIHISNFAGQDKTLLMYDSIEKEEAFYIYDNNKLSKQQGYYIYYEKNEEMQNYMVENKQVPSEEEVFDDRAMKEIRNIIETKKEIKSQKESGSVVNVLYGASTLLAVVVLVIGATMLNNYDQMRTMEETLSVISDHVVGDNESSNKIDKTEVKTMNGEIEKIKGNETTDNKNNSENTQNDAKVSNDSEKLPIKLKENTSSSEKQPEDPPAAKKYTQKKVVKKTAKKAADNSSNTKKAVKEYVVKEGDTLAKISEKYYKSIYQVEKILKANNINNKDKIVVGQKIIIPE